MKINRLSTENNPYLLRYADGPVDWYPWRAEAFEKASSEGRPVFLFIGYSACRWCHLMERESFRDDEIADIVNREFIPVKVDREERPDLDHIYLTAVQLMTGKAGWPLTVFLTPDRLPFFGGTYFPAEPQENLPALRSVLNSVAKTYREQMDRVRHSAAVIARQVRSACYSTPSPGPVGWNLIERATQDFEERFDKKHAGFRGAPKFPPAVALGFLLRVAHRTGDPTVGDVIRKTLDRMARGGIYDHLGGGFHRYSTDARWLIPNFEKMLPDNALLGSLYLDAYLATGDPSYLGTATETLRYCLRELEDPRGGFRSSQDAESEAEEGRYYLWPEDEILDVLGPKDGRLFSELFGVTALGNFEKGTNVIHLTSSVREFAEKAGLPEKEAEARIAGWKEALYNRRRTRVAPAADDKIITAWNGLMISALARAAQVTRDPVYLRTAQQTARFILTHLKDADGTLMRFHRAGRSKQRAFLDDYAHLAAGLLDLYETDFDARWLLECRNLVDRLLDLLWDDRYGGFYFSPENGEIARPKVFEDGPLPSGNSIATLTLLRLGVLLHSTPYLERAFRSLEACQGLVEKVPFAHPGMLSALHFYLSPSREIAIAGRPGEPKTRALLEKIWSVYLPNRVVALADPDAGVPLEIPLLEEKGTVEGQPAVYLCEDYECETPIVDPEELARELGSEGGQSRSDRPPSR